MKRILIVGANGFTGRRILEDLVKPGKHELTGCSLHPDISPSAGYVFTTTDVRDERQVERLFDAICPDVVINTSALSVPDYCEIHREEAWTTNVTAVEYLARHCEKHNSRFIHLSTDFVFEGNTSRLYTEDDLPNPINYYGITKWEGEKQIARISSNYAVVRVVVVYGKAYPGQHGNILQLVANKLRAGDSIRVVSDQWRTPTFVGDISMGIERLIHYPNNGIYHLCGPEYLTIADIAFRVADFLQLDSSLLIPVTTEEMSEATPRPRFSGLSIEKAKAELDFSPHTLEDGMKKMFG